MKNMLKYSSFFFAGLLMAACTEDYKDWGKPISYAQDAAATVPTVTATAAVAGTIDMETADPTILLLNFSLPEDGSVVLKNILFTPVVDGTEVADAAISATDAKGTFTTSSISDMVRALYGKKRLERTVDGKITANAFINGSSEATLLNCGTASVKVLLVDPGYENFYLVGTPNGWNISTKGTYMIPVEKGIYSFTTSFTGAWDFKFISDTDQQAENPWNCCWGNSFANNDLKANSGTLHYGEGTAEVGCLTPEEAGFYTFVADMNNSTYTFTKLDNQEPTEYTSMGVIGGFNDWGGDVEMTQAAPHFWYAEYTIEQDTELKFRANGGWDVNWGADVTINDETFYGVSTPNGVNIKVPAGTYAFYLNDITGEFAILRQ